MQEELEVKRLIGVRADPTYQTMRQMIMNNRMKTHEFSENSKLLTCIRLTFICFINREDNRNQKEQSAFIGQTAVDFQGKE